MAVDVGAVYAATYSTFLFVVVMVVALVFNKGGVATAAPAVATSGFKVVLSYIPYLLIGIGFLVSFITLKFKYMVSSLYGLMAIAICFVGTFAFGKFLPQLVASSAAILTYFTYDYVISNIHGNIVKNILASLLSLVILLGQMLSTSATPGAYLFSASLLNDGLGAILGISIGLSAWFTIHSTSPNMLPFTGTEDFTQKNRKEAGNPL